MEKIFNKVNNIRCGTSVQFTSDCKRRIMYTITDEEVGKSIIMVTIPKFIRPKRSDEIVNSSEFVNGFKVVQTSNLEYAYIRESDGMLLPYRYDVASPFNEYGYAMVARDGNATWINKDFQYFSKDFKMVDDKADSYYYRHNEFNAFQEVSQFSSGKYPLSKLYDRREEIAKTIYFNKEGNKQDFYIFEGNFNGGAKFEELDNISFDDKDYIVTSHGILFSKGYYCPSRYALELCESCGVIDELLDSIDSSYNEKCEKVLKK